MHDTLNAGRALAMRLLAMLIVALLVNGAAMPAVAGPLEDAIHAYAKDDYATALRLLRPLAEQGEAKAQYNLGLMYEKGRGVPQDYSTALSWYRKAANQGDADGQVSLGSMYNSGQGVPEDYVQAPKWYNLAAAQGGRDRPVSLASLAVFFRDSVAKLMTPAQIAEAQKLAREWKPK